MRTCKKPGGRGAIPPPPPPPFYYRAFALSVEYNRVMKSLAEYLDLAAQAHGHLCAGQVLGVRLAMLGLRELGIDDPIAERKRIVTYVEIDRCVTDAVALVANCR